MKILVTGGAGFIGSHITDALIAEGHSVVVLDNLSSGRIENLNPNSHFIQGDIRDIALIDRIFKEHRFEIVNHHAAQMDVRKSVEDPIFDAETNIIGSLNLLEACRKYSVGRFVFASTGGAIYGEQDYFPADENHATRPESPYGVAKCSIELYLHYYLSVHGMQHTIFRYANVYGPRQDPHGEAGVVAIFTNALLAERQCVIFGDGKQTRDYVYIGDVVRAHIEALKKGGESETFNISTGIETDVNSLFSMLSKITTGGKATVQYADARKGEQKRSVCSAAKAEEVLGWRPAVKLEDGLRSTVEYFQKALA
ncbi:MAG: GDP-mannose 4,6-dehydratase [Bacteroidota bacterium]|nr:GDP-mannose 4,6-dehydratase [Bacteroidota bacterium]MDP4231397.1 GDP-mannose 4,6-dehydratase [Bacteroidota bacterium]